MRAISHGVRRGLQGACALGLVFASLSLGTAGAATNTITVNSTADTATSGDHQCTLREAIANANGNIDTTNKDCKAGKPGMDVIAFKIAGPAPQVITITSDLPSISDPVTLDGTTQPANKGAVAATPCASGPVLSPRIALDFTNLGNDGLNITASGTIVRGFAITRPGSTPTYALHISGGSGVRIECNAIGVTTANTNPPDSFFHDILIDASASNAIIGTNGDGVNDAKEGNSINNTSVGIYINANQNTVVAGNSFGLGLDGQQDMQNSTSLYFRQTSYYTRVGTNGDGISDSAERNLFGGGNNGVQLDTSPGADNHSVIAGNWFGSDINGSARSLSTGILVQNGNDLTIGYPHGSTDGGLIGDDMHNIFVKANTAAIQIQSGAGLTVIGGNTFDNTPIGIDYGGASLSPGSSYNCFETANTAVKNTTAQSLPLGSNWWNSNDGPSGDGSGIGDAITNTGGGSIDYSSFLTNTDTCRDVSASPGPVLSAPPLGIAIGISKSAALKWSKVTGADGYNVAVSVLPDFTGSVDTFSVSGASTRSAPQSTYGRYYWKVQAILGFNTSAWSDGRYYDVTVMSAPKNLAKGSATKPTRFSWKADKAVADSYRIDIANTPYFGPSIIYTNTGTALSFSQLLPSGTWYWRVTLINAGVDQAVMPAWVVTVP